MKKKRKNKTTKNTMPNKLNRIEKLSEYTMDINGKFTLVTDIFDTKIFDKYYRQWFDDPATTMWCGESLASYIKDKLPNNICLLKEDYLKFIEGKGVTHATKEEYEAENN